MCRITTIVLFSLIFAGCEGGWLREDREMFLESCTLGRETPAGHSEAYCQCRLEQTIKIYPTINALVENKDSIKLREALKQCQP